MGWANSKTLCVGPLVALLLILGFHQNIFPPGERQGHWGQLYYPHHHLFGHDEACKGQGQLLSTWPQQGVRAALPGPVRVGACLVRPSDIIKAFCSSMDFRHLYWHMKCSTCLSYFSAYLLIMVPSICGGEASGPPFFFSHGIWRSLVQLDWLTRDPKNPLTFTSQEQACTTTLVFYTGFWD